jgi:phosphate:Na+ symporter
MKREYQGFRRMVAKVLRSIQFMKDVQNPEKNKKHLEELKRFYREKLQRTNKRIDKLIRKNLIDVDMASSLVNDHANVNDMIEKLIEICELLFVESGSIIDPMGSENDHAHRNTDPAP